jgi:hypothetical protein
MCRVSDTGRLMIYPPVLMAGVRKPSGKEPAGGGVGGLVSMGICRGSVLGRGCTGRRNGRRTDDHDVVPRSGFDRCRHVGSLPFRFGPMLADRMLALERHVEYQSRGGHGLLARLYRPGGSGPFPAVVQVRSGSGFCRRAGRWRGVFGVIEGVARARGGRRSIVLRCRRRGFPRGGWCDEAMTGVMASRS